MKSFKKIIILLSILYFPVRTVCQTPVPDREAIRNALIYQQTNYPVSQYRDVYKNFMQDFYGPGHLLTNLTASENYLKSELAETENFDGPDYEPTGFMGNFYRVNLGLVANGVIPYDIFFDTFVSSVQNIQTPEPEEWMEIWTAIDNEIKNLGWHFENEDTDRQELQQQFKENNFIAHHSRAYNDNVNFHYRIISKDKFMEVILPYLENQNQ